MTRWMIGWLPLLMVSLLLALSSESAVAASPAATPETLRRAAEQLAAGPAAPDERDAHRWVLRAAGQAGFDALEAAFQEAVAPAALKPGLVDQLRADLDAVSGQRYGHRSRLYWHTHLHTARRVAQAENKPILSLRLLGELTDEYSCANSRFFRTILYVDPVVGDFLREHFVLHWQSVREVPQVTVTLADGRTLRRTVTGNSAHLVIAPSGQVVDILPGLWHPQAFVEALGHSAALARSIATEPDWRDAVRRWHVQRLAEAQEQFGARLRAVDLSPEDVRHVTAGTDDVAPASLLAEAVMPRAMSKAVVEAPLIEPIRLVSAPQMWAQLRDQAWARLAESERPAVQLSDATRMLIRQENGAAVRDLDALEANLVAVLAGDTLFNRFILREQIHRWFAQGQATELRERELVSRLYLNILGMDLSDPWAGLHDPAVYTGLDRGGVVEPGQIRLTRRRGSLVMPE